MFTEVATAGQGADKAEWIRTGFLSAIPTLFPKVVAVIWWERDDQTDWRISSSKASEAAWRAVVNSPLYGGHGSADAAPSQERRTSIRFAPFRRVWSAPVRISRARLFDLESAR
jgi:hypothetical protein